MAIPQPKHMLSPGEILSEIYMKDQGFNQTSLAKALNCKPGKINEIVNRRRAISPKFAIQLSMVLKTTSTLWIRLQADYDLFLAQKKFDEEFSEKTKIG